jgi:hypothetical protein
VLAWFRQLYSSDDLFCHAANVYLRYAAHEGKRAWLDHVRSDFNRLRDAPPSLNRLTEHSRRELIDLIAYGARVLHRKSKSDAEQVLQQLIARHGDAEVAMAANTAMRDLLGQASLAYHVIKQDFDHWVATGIVPRPTLTDLDDLMRSDR